MQSIRTDDRQILYVYSKPPKPSTCMICGLMLRLFQFFMILSAGYVLTTLMNIKLNGRFPVGVTSLGGPEQ